LARCFGLHAYFRRRSWPCALLAASEFWFFAVKWVGVAYLAYLGFRLLRSKGVLAVPDASALEQPSTRGIFLRSFLVAVTNPKGYLFFSAFLPQFINPNEPQLQQYAALAVTFAAIDFTVMLAYAATGARPYASFAPRSTLARPSAEEHCWHSPGRSRSIAAMPSRV
jgi:threonine/homoserine/homoserine lactone efflux protein